MTPEKLRSLIALAGDERTPVEEARTAGVQACREIVRGGLVVGEKRQGVAVRGWPKFDVSLGMSDERCARCGRPFPLNWTIVRYSDGDVHCLSCSKKAPMKWPC